MLESRPLVPGVLLLLVTCSPVSLCLGQLDTVCNNSQLTQCDDCIKASPLCSWCPILPSELKLFTGMEIFENYTYDNYRCRDERTFPIKCADTPLSVLHGPEQNPKSNLNKIEDEELSMDATGSQTIQFRPQDVSIKLRQGETVSFNVTFISLRNHPLDVYFLPDVSASLQTTINSIRNDTITIAEALRNISSGFAIGFGSFVDKRILPFAPDNLLAYINASELGTKCRSFDECANPYAYHHSLSLTSDVKHFQKILPDISELSGNYDQPESSLDALMQATICADKIGWREDSLKMVFLFTDQGYKTAGDGKLAGIVQPNSGQCGLALIPDSNPIQYEYVQSLNEDYVSIGQLRNAIETNRVVPIFVIQSYGSVSSSTTVRAYEALKAEIPSLQVQPFDAQSTFGNQAATTEELISIIDRAYNNIVRIVAVTTQPVNVDGYRFNITPVGECKKTETTPEGACSVDFDETVTFSVSVTLEDCSVAQERSIQLTGRFKLTSIKLEPLCSCPCSAPEQHITNESVCSMGKGNLTCGVCECEGDLSGPECQCSQMFNMCKTIEDCNGFECHPCGYCLCNDTQFGDNCECDETTTTCPKGVSPDGNNTELCSGTERGECDCISGLCKCSTAPLSGKVYFHRGATAAEFDEDKNNCECDPDKCYNPNYPQGLCYNRVSLVPQDSLCGCNGCNCDDPLFIYTNTCINTDALCTLLSPCVNCFLDSPCTNPPCSVTGCDETCLVHKFEQVNEEEELIAIPEGYRDRCTLAYMDCTVEFYFSSDTDDPVVIEGSSQFSCPPGPVSNIYWIVAGVLVGAILIIGILALIILKICLVIIERMEYKKFSKELQEASFAPYENPLYITPQQEYMNPLRRSTTRRSQ